MAGPKIPWRPGRIDGFATNATPDGRLPDATQGADHLRNVSKFAARCQEYTYSITVVSRFSGVWGMLARYYTA
jgi:hypothetical protein